MKRTCRRTGKRNFQSENSATKALERLAEFRERGGGNRYYGNERRCYKCTHCPYWHLTSQEPRVG